MQLTSIGHKFLYQANIFYYNISIKNIFFKEDEIDGFMINLNLAVDINQLKAFETSKKTGIKVFMIIGTFNDNSHMFIYNLKLFF